MKLRPLSVAIALALLAIFPFQATEQFPSRIFRSVDRVPDFHPSQVAVFHFDILDAIGGVLSQANSLSTITAAGGTFSLTVDLEGGEYPGYLTVHHLETRAPYSIDYPDLVPMALFVDSGATSLYTLWGEDELPEDFLRRAGFVGHHIEGNLALEFDGTRYADALYFIDLCEDCLGRTQLPVDVDLEKNLWKSANRRSESSYLNTDVNSPFRFSLADGRVDLSGSVVRFEWRTDESVSVTARPVLPVPVSNVASLLREFSDLSRFTVLDERAVQPLREAAAAVDAAMRQSLDEAFFLFETLALLRTAKTEAPDEWSEFMRLLRSEPLVNADPTPWDRYTRSFCRAYPQTTECPN